MAFLILRKRGSLLNVFGRILLVLILGIGQASSQTLSLSEAGTLSPVLSETSGLETSGTDGYWTHNDSGGQPKLYRINASGMLERTVHVSGATNMDWEDLTRDAAGNLYIGDFGNNSNSRTDLTIYKVPDPDASLSDTVAAVTIQFHYPEQSAFPPPPAQLQCDLEAMVHLNGNLFLFTKNRSEPFSGYTRMYRVPDAPGTYAAQLLDSFYAGPGPALTDWITAADISPDRQKLVLLSYNKLWLFPCRNGRPLLSGAAVSIPFSGGTTLKEGVVFTDNQRVAISDEALTTFLPPRLYTADLGPWIPINCCEKPAGLRAVPAGSNKLRFIWRAIPGADGYRARIRGNDGSLAQRTGSDTTQLFSGLTPGLTYQGFAQARCGNQVSAPSDTITYSLLRLASSQHAAKNKQASITLLCSPYRECWLDHGTSSGVLQLINANGAITINQQISPQQIIRLESLPAGWYAWMFTPDGSCQHEAPAMRATAGSCWLP